jgi:hypothetical protein
MTPYKTARCIFVPEAPLIGTGVNISLVSGKRDPLPSAASDGALDPTHASTMTFPDFCEGPGKCYATGVRVSRRKQSSGDGFRFYHA